MSADPYPLQIGAGHHTTTHAGKLIMTVFAGIAEFERDLIRERTSAGREAARRRGIHFVGRPRKLNPEYTKLARRLIDEGQPVREVADTFNVHTRNNLSAIQDGGLSAVFCCVARNSLSVRNRVSG
jgi:DNA invertase Pin-like site-specific DNA recombinase